MKVQIVFFANIKQSAGMDTLDIECASRQECSFPELLDAINSRLDITLCSYKSKKKSAIPIRAALNGSLIHALEQTPQKIKDGDCITVFPLLSAG